MSRSVPSFVSYILLVVVLLASPASSQPLAHVDGRVIDQERLVLPGVTVRLTQQPTGAEVVIVTQGDGRFAFDVIPGTYRLDAGLDGFESVTREVRVAGPLTLDDVVLTLATFSQETTVVASMPTELQPKSFGAPLTLAEHVIAEAPMRSGRYDDVLPLLPNVLRGPDGLISVAGARAPQGIALLNGVPSADIASGEPHATVPLAAIETVQVITTGFPAEFGRSTGGVTIINSRSGGDALRFSINSFTPRVRLHDGGTRGIEAWSPNAGIRGPLVRGKVWFAESVDYNYERTLADTIDGEQDRRQHELASFTQFDARPAANHAVTVWINGHTDSIDALGLNAFTPLGTVPRSNQRDGGGAVIDRITVGASSTIETRIDARRQTLRLTPEGSSDYLVAHDGTRGSYFNTTDRHATSVQAASVFSRLVSRWHGDHLIKAGASVSYSSLEGTEIARPVLFLRSSLLPARVVSFSGSGAYASDAADGGAFVQDEWRVLPGVRLDLGARVDYASRVGGLVAPRVGLTWTPDERTTVTAGGGRFADKAPLAALAFDARQSRTVTAFDPEGLPSGQPVTYVNVVDDNLDRARAALWSVQVDRRLNGVFQLRTGYQERHGSHELVVSPETPATGAVALLSSTGRSRSRSAEVTLGIKPSQGRQAYVSYVRSSSRGNVNDFSQIDGTFRDPWLDTATTAALPSDVPHRLLVWGVFSLPREASIAPFIDVRSGFPFSAVHDDWTYAGTRNSQRYPAFASLDLVVTKMVTLPGGMRARVGLKFYNIAGRRNGRDVQRNIDGTGFGDTLNPLGRQFRGVFELVWNRSPRP